MMSNARRKLNDNKWFSYGLKYAKIRANTASTATKNLKLDNFSPPTPTIIIIIYKMGFTKW